MVDRIRKLCSDNKTSIKALEKELGFGNGTIRRWNENTPSVERIVAVANYFNVPVAYLMGWDDELSKLNQVGMSEDDVAAEMGMDPDVLNDFLAGNDVGSVEAVSKITRVASLIAKEKSPTPEGVELSKENIQMLLEKMSVAELAEVMANCAEEIRKRGAQ